MIGRTVGDYKVHGQMGVDAFGVVYHAQHTGNGWHVALRQFEPALCDPAVVKVYGETAKGAMQANHPCVLHVLETFFSGRNAFLVSELVEGETLAMALQRDRRLWPELAVKIGWQIAQTLQATHAVNVPHRALRPEGIYVSPDTAWPGGFRSKIVDYGCHAFLGAGSSGTPDWRSPRVEALGLPLYLSPEQCRGAPGDARADVYALGCLIYHLSCGRPPFMGQSPYDLATAHQQTQPQRPTTYEQSIHTEVEAMVMAMINKETAGRPSMAQVVGELERIAHIYWPANAAMKTISSVAGFGKPPKGRGHGKRWLIAAIAAVVCGGGGAAIAVAMHNRGAGSSSGDPAAQKAAGSGAAVDAGASHAAAGGAADAGVADTPEKQEEKHLAAARRLLAAEKPDEALAEAKAAAKLAPKDAEAARLIALAKAEPANKKLYDAFTAAAGKSDAPKAVAAYAKIPAESVYREKATAELDKLRTAWVHDAETKAHGLAAAHACAKIDPIIKDVKGVFPESTAPIEAVKRSCTLK